MIYNNINNNYLTSHIRFSVKKKVSGQTVLNLETKDF